MVAVIVNILEFLYHGFIPWFLLVRLEISFLRYIGWPCSEIGGDGTATIKLQFMNIKATRHFIQIQFIFDRLFISQKFKKKTRTNE